MNTILSQLLSVGLEIDADEIIKLVAPGRRMPMARAIFQKVSRELLRLGFHPWELAQIFGAMSDFFLWLDRKPKEREKFIEADG